MEEYRPEREVLQNLKIRPNEQAGKWAERLLIATVNNTRVLKAEPANEDEDRWGVDMWISPEGGGIEVPVDLTLTKDPKVLGEKERRALVTGIAIFATNKHYITADDLHCAALGGEEFKTKVLNALNAAIADWLQKLGEAGKSFITREELAAEIAKEEAQQRMKPRGRFRRRGKRIL